MDFAIIVAWLGALTAGAMALAITWKERRSLTWWAFGLGMALLAAESIFVGLSADAVTPLELAHWQNWRLLAMALLPAPWLFFSLTYARGNSSEFLARWRIPLLAALLLPASLAAASAGRFVLSAGQDQSGNHWRLTLGIFGFGLNLLLLLTAVLILMNLERTFRSSVGTMRWRIKFMLLGLALLFTVRAYTASQVLLFHAINPLLQTFDTAALLLACLLILRSLSRSGHFDVSVYPSHSVLHGSFTVLLAGLYLLIVGLLAKVVTYLGGDHAFSLKAFLILMLLVVLAITLFSQKVRLHTSRFVSRHFQRPQYDYRTVWKTFTEGTTRLVEQNVLAEALVKLISEVFHALSVTIWLVDNRRQTLSFAASTSVSRPAAAALTLDSSDMAQVISALRAHPQPLDIDSSKEIWAILLRRLHPDDFHKGGNRICVPLLTAGDLLGVITLGDRVGGVPYSLQDFDLLKSVSDQAAANLLNIQLSQRLAQSKQLEAFQAMSAFFVHDLKNTASTLSLMLQNLPVHFNDPAFREDALRGISKTVIHINELIGRLGLLRQELAVHPAELDLNDLVTETLQSLPPAPQIVLLKELQPLPKVSLDRSRIQNVLTNLVLNARESLASGGQIRVQTSQRNGWAVLAVSDNGCGMSPEFIEHSLFRPFQSTKKQGIGIGMFQSHMVVEAHRGRIEVESEPGKGTSFRVLLPLSSSSLAAPKSDEGGSSPRSGAGG